jgi:predicted dehydrogenase
MKSNRREFIKTSALGVAGITLSGMGLNASVYNRILGSNDRINVAIIGLGRRLGAFTEPIALQPVNARLLYLCDVMKKQRDNAASTFARHLDYQPKLENDFRRVLEDKDVDVIINATPDHWHAPGAILGVQAGKHVYVEKPGSHNPWENEQLVKARQKYGKIIQLGNQQRSAVSSRDLIKKIHDGVIGTPYSAVAFYSNGRGEVVNQTQAPIPDGLDWDLFQGPAPRRDYTNNTWDYNWHWYGWDFGTAEMGNNAIHELDIARWALQVDYPERVDVNAGKMHFPQDGWTMYDTMYATYHYPGNKQIVWDGKSRNNYNTYGSDRGTIIYGTNGSAFVNRNGYKIFDRSGKQTSEMREGGSESGTALGGGGDMSTTHVVNFFESIRGREKQTSPIEEMVKSIQMCHMANIIYRTGKKSMVFNPANGTTRDADARKLWKRQYASGWEPRV